MTSAAGSAGLEDPGEPLSEAAAEAYVASTCFKTGPPARVGVELELIPVRQDDWSAPVDHHRVLAILDGLGPLPAGGSLTVEPGGQVELSTLPAPDLGALVAAAAPDLAALRTALADERICLLGSGADPLRPPVRVLDQPRYAAMERHLDRWGGAGRTMMCCTAAVQASVEAVSAPPAAADVGDRWDLLHEVGPTLVAAFANSPYLSGRRTGWKSARQAAWWGFDPSRTRPVRRLGHRGRDPREDCARYALDAAVMIVRRRGPSWSAPPGLTFRSWVRGAWRHLPGLRAPVLEDLDYHLTTLFPPVRARGPLEVRYLDAQPGDSWRVPVAILTGLLSDRAAADQARAAAEPVRGCWEVAARDGLDDPGLGRSAVVCLSAARDALARSAFDGHNGVDIRSGPGSDRAVLAEVDAFIERFTCRRRSPADEQLQHRPWPPTPAQRAEILESQPC
jgi:glutamate--cysteine ligase